MTDLPHEPLAADDGDAWLDAQLAALRPYTPRPGFEARVLMQVDGWLDAQLDHLPVFEPSADLEARVMARVRVPVPSLAMAPVMPAAVPAPQRRRRVALAAAGVAGAMGASAWWSVTHQPLLQELIAAARGEVLTAYAGAVRSGLEQLASVPVIGTLRNALFATPSRLALVGTGVALVYATSVLALRRLLALPQTVQAHAAR